MTRKQYKYATKGQTLRSKIGREAKWPPKRIRQFSKINLPLTLSYVVTSPVQEYDHDMADSSSPPNNKRSQLPIQLSNQQKKTKSDLQFEHA
jgi:hypothetical protein